MLEIKRHCLYVCICNIFNTNEISYAFINQQYITHQAYSIDSGFIDVAPYLQNGLNSFIFLTYNFENMYTWGFQIMKNNEIIFDDTGGLLDVLGANNDDYSLEYQFVYNNTISINITKYTTLITTSSTGEFFLILFLSSYNIN